MGLFYEIIEEALGKQPRELRENRHTMDYVRLSGPAVILAEGLIMTYPIELVIKSIAKIFNLATDPDDYTPYGYICHNYGENETEVIEVEIPNDPKNKAMIDKYMNKYGWFSGSINDGHDEGMINIWYEKKFDFDATEIAHENNLYHICPTVVMEKIMSKGLTPKESSWTTFHNDERVYLFVEEPDDESFRYWCYDFKKNKKINSRNTGFALLEIDTSKINKNIKFYYDPRMTDGIYTMDTISPEAITVVKQITI